MVPLCIRYLFTYFVLSIRDSLRSYIKTEQGVLSRVTMYQIRFPCQSCSLMEIDERKMVNDVEGQNV